MASPPPPSLRDDRLSMEQFGRLAREVDSPACDGRNAQAMQRAVQLAIRLDRMVA